MKLTKALELAAQAWCAEGTRNTIMDPELCKQFAEILQENSLKNDTSIVEAMKVVHEQTKTLTEALANVPPEAKGIIADGISKSVKMSLELSRLIAARNPAPEDDEEEPEPAVEAGNGTVGAGNATVPPPPSAKPSKAK